MALPCAATYAAVVVTAATASGFEYGMTQDTRGTNGLPFLRLCVGHVLPGFNESRVKTHELRTTYKTDFVLLLVVVG